MTNDHDDEPVDIDAERAELDSPASQDRPSEVIESESTESAGGFALLVLALLVLVGGSVFFVGKLLSQKSETEAAQAQAEEAIAEFDGADIVEFIPDEAADTTPPSSLPLVVEEDPDAAQSSDAAPESTTSTTEVPQPSVDPADIGIAFVNRVPGEDYAKVGYVDPQGERHITELECDRLDLNEAGGICLSATAGLAGTGRGLLLTPDLNPTTKFGVNKPSRAGVSPDGAVVAWTGFSAGHSYLEVGEFATTTQLISVERGIGANLETVFNAYDVEGSLIDDIDRNYWGVSFVDRDLFYATLGYRGQTTIVEGRVSTSRLDVVAENASCPEISPDGTKIVAKERRGDAFQLVLIDIESGSRRDLGETRSVDDQVEWLDDNNILYGMPNLDEGTEAQPVFDIYALNVDPGSAPKLIIPFADSPAA